MRGPVWRVSSSGDLIRNGMIRKDGSGLRDFGEETAILLTLPQMCPEPALANDRLA
jgi:hypothetical protein|eukprot:COSAG06_NODE_25671_length_631_cov_1.031955_1_plen_56_part_00